MGIWPEGPVCLSLVHGMKLTLVATVNLPWSCPCPPLRLHLFYWFKCPILISGPLGPSSYVAPWQHVHTPSHFDIILCLKVDLHQTITSCHSYISSLDTALYLSHCWFSMFTAWRRRKNRWKEGRKEGGREKERKQGGKGGERERRNKREKKGFSFWLNIFSEVSLSSKSLGVRG